MWTESEIDDLLEKAKRTLRCETPDIIDIRHIRHSIFELRVLPIKAIKIEVKSVQVKYWLFRGVVSDSVDIPLDAIGIICHSLEERLQNLCDSLAEIVHYKKDSH